ncbi:hypothetical protein [Paraburkholderia sp. DHOC27]|uniref:hypothetical protein n=1 Tax=Paraburkholderia sp. DHOC27 TaxID=2303330 RepID=UPI000E3DCA35|nr:hypothetical protein [Paraburkholderia sp. DHOC27]RFU43994.1 hypothetical protein D0B32_30895 [Paraburkholderia sp. DHOC27]
MAKAELVVQVMEAGSNNMGTYQALMGVAQNPNDSLSIMQTGTTLVATVTNVTQMLQPIRVMTNGLVATTALTKIMVDWKDPNKKVNSGDVLTLVSASGTIVLTVLALAEIGPSAAAAVGAIVLAADLQAAMQPYFNSVKIMLGNLVANQLQLTKPASTASASLYWGSAGVGNGYNLYTYDEIMFSKGLFACMSDQGASGAYFIISGSPVPGSLTPVSESMYKENYCQYLAKEQQWSDMTSGMQYCTTTKFR